MEGKSVEAVEWSKGPKKKKFVSKMVAAITEILIMNESNSKSR